MRWPKSFSLMTTSMLRPAAAGVRFDGSVAAFRSGSVRHSRRSAPRSRGYARRAECSAAVRRPATTCHALSPSCSAAHSTLQPASVYQCGVLISWNAATGERRPGIGRRRHGRRRAARHGQAARGAPRATLSSINPMLRWILHCTRVTCSHVASTF